MKKTNSIERKLDQNCKSSKQLQGVSRGRESEGKWLTRIKLKVQLAKMWCLERCKYLKSEIQDHTWVLHLAYQ